MTDFIAKPLPPRPKLGRRTEVREWYTPGQRALLRVIELVGTQRRVASALNPPQTRTSVGQWLLKGNRVPAEHCPRLQAMTGHRVLASELRPDIEWHFLDPASRIPEADMMRGVARPPELPPPASLTRSDVFDAFAKTAPPPAAGFELDDRGRLHRDGMVAG